MFPLATLISSCSPSVFVAVKHKAKGSASSGYHSIFNMFVPVKLSTASSTFLSLTAQRCIGFASASAPVKGLSISSKINTSPTFNLEQGSGGEEVATLLSED